MSRASRAALSRALPLACALACALPLACALTDGRAERAPARLDLRVRALPPPTSLRMRRELPGCPPGATCSARLAAAPAGPAAPDLPIEDLPPAQPTMQSAAARLHPLLGVLLDDRPLSDKLVFRFSLGMGFDGGERARSPWTGEQRLDATSYAHLRVYQFGDAVIGSRGLLAPSLSTYLAAQFRAQEHPGALATAIPSVHDALFPDGSEVDALWIRSAHAQLDGMFSHRLLAPLWVRAGRQHRYGPAIAHYDGLTVGYDGQALTMATFVGRGVDVTGFRVDAAYRDQGLMLGGDARLDLHALRGVPLVVGAGLLRFDGINHVDLSLALRWSPDMSMAGSVRLLDGARARTRLDAHARVSRVTTVSVQLDDRSDKDWMYDLFASRPTTISPSFLRLGAPAPRLHLGLRAGTVLLGNVDVLVHGGAALRRDRDQHAASAHAADYGEAGAAVEVRLRRTLAMGLSALVRRYRREQPATANPRPDSADELDIDIGAAGETSFAEGVALLRYDLGARRFSASAELYARRYDVQSPYVDLEADLVARLSGDVRGGARFGMDTWAGERLRLRFEYDVSTAMRVAPELLGVKSLRILAEGRF